MRRTFWICLIVTFICAADEGVSADLDSRVVFAGLKDGAAVARLYQSGSYDRPVVIPAPFDPRERTRECFTEEHVYELFETLMVDLFKEGFDVWIVRTKTGQNIHEQAAEFAQVVDYAALRAGPDAKVIVVGFSLGGVTARLATARFEADPEWRTSLGLRDELPVSLVVFGDAPLEGAHFNLCFQQEIWKRGKAGDSNLNSCGAQQLLRTSVSGLDGVWSPTLNWQRFYVRGEAVYLDTAGVCDRQGVTPDGVPACICDPGPALLSVNGDGWPHGPRIIAFSNGMAGPMMCYGDWRDENRNGARVCALVSGATGPRELRSGDDLYKFRLPVKRDVTCKAQPEDVVGGSRLSSVMTKTVRLLFWKYGLEQSAHGTFIPYESALPAGAPFFDTMHNTHQGIHGSGYRPIIDWTVDHMKKASCMTSTSSHSQKSAETVTPIDERTGDAPVTVTFPVVLRAGTTTLKLRSTGPNPWPRHSFGAPPVHYELSTTSAFKAESLDPITICIHYGGVNFMDETELMLIQYEDDCWIDRTSLRDRLNDTLCGAVTSLGVFAIAEPTIEPG